MWVGRAWVCLCLIVFASLVIYIIKLVVCVVLFIFLVSTMIYFHDCIYLSVMAFDLIFICLSLHITLYFPPLSASKILFLIVSPPIPMQLL